MFKKCVNAIMVIWAFLFMQTSMAQTSYPVTIQTLVVPPISPYISRLLSPGGGGYVAAMLRNTSANGGVLRVKLYGTLERLSPSPFTITVNANYQPQQPIILPPNVPVNLTGDFLQQVFANFDPNQLVFQNTSINAFKSDVAGGGYRLPEGTYRLCFAAYNYDQPGYTTPLSVPNTGCAVINICYQASAPQIIQPVNSMNLTSSVGTVSATSPVIFTWTTPALTCGALISPLQYTLEIHQVFPNQTPTDAMNNPPVFIKQGLTTPTYPFDTNLYKNILNQGTTYAIRVRASTGNLANNATTFANNGYSAPQAFQYGTVFPIVDQMRILTPGGGQGSTPGTGTGGNCGITPPSSTTSATGSLSGATLTIGGFTLKTGSVTTNPDGTFSGSGTIAWTPAGAPINLAVTFSNINVNTNNQVYGGTVVASVNAQALPAGSNFSQFSTFAQQSGTQLDQLTQNLNSYLTSNPAASMVSKITGTAPVSLPLGLDNQSFGGSATTMDIVSIVFSPRGAVMSVLYSMKVPEAGSAITLVGANLCISPTGMSFGKGTLSLPADRSFNLGGQVLTFNGSATGDSTKGTYLTWSNGSMTDIVAHATMSLPRNTIVPEDASGNVTNDSVKAALVFTFHDWDNWVAAATLPHFQINGVKGLSFEPGTLYYDHSTTTNAPGFEAPPDYPGSSGVDFEGIFIKRDTILLPATFTTFNNSGKRTSFLSSNFIMDDQGVSVNIAGYKVIDITAGSLGGWSFSLDTVKVDVVANTFKSGSFAGGILLPVSKTPIHYDGDMQVGSGGGPMQYQFVAKPQSDMTFDLWAAQVTLDANSSFSIGTDAQGTAIAATLNGKVSLNPGGVSFPGLSFDSLGFSNRNGGSPGFSLNQGTWSFASPQKYIGTNTDNSGDVSGFPVSINNIAPYFNTSTSGTTESIDLGVKFNLNVTLGDVSVVSGTANLAVYGSIKASMNNSFAPSIKLGGPTVKLDTLSVNGDVGPVSIKGMLVFYKNDPTFGNGFKGSVSADFTIVSGSATAQFGSVNNYNYWFVDASLNLPPPGILLGSSSLSIVGFGGGAYYNMSMYQSTLPSATKIPANVNNANPTPGSSVSGAAYVPKQGTAGMMASIALADVNPDIINATVTLTGQISHGALSDLDIKGAAYAITDYPGNSSAVVTGTIDINWDIADKSFTIDASLKGNFVVATVNVPFHFYAGPDGFYFKLGDPAYLADANSSNYEISIQLSKINTAIFSENIGFEAYFAFGAGNAFQPNFPPLPDYITAAGLHPSQTATSIISALNSSTKDAALLTGARGNASLSFDLAIFYASGAFDIGFDLEIAKYVNAQCSGSNIGWDGWYALGQIYANMDFDIGINVDVWFFSGKIDLCNFGAAALLQAGLPNPVWVSGDAEAHGSVLDGLISFNTSFHFTIGNPCYPTPHDPLADIQIISDYGPTDSCSIYDKPYLASNEGLEKSFSIPIPPTAQYPNGSTRTYEFTITSYKLSYSKNGQTTDQPVTLEYENSNKSVNIDHEATLQPNTVYTATVVCNAKQNENGAWTDPYVDSLKRNMPMKQTTTFQFKTGPAPGNIPDKIVHFTYPVNKQRYVLKKEFGGAGVMQFNEWPDYLFDPSTSQPAASGALGDLHNSELGVHTEYLVYFIDVAGKDTIKTPFTPANNGHGGQLNYTFPSNLKNGTIYREEFWKVESTPLVVSLPGKGAPAGVNTLSVSTRTLDLSYGNQPMIHMVSSPGAQLQNGVSTAPTTGLSNAQNITGVTEKQSNLVNGGKGTPPAPKPLYVTYFGTSGFNTLSDKLNGLGSGNWPGFVGSNFLSITIMNPSGKSPHWELFDAYEMTGFTTPDNTKMPSLFYIDIPWDDNDANDNCVTNSLYKAGENLVDASGVKTLKIEYDNSGGVQRDQDQRPIHTVSWLSNSWGDPVLSEGDCSYGGQTNIDADEASVNEPYAPNPFTQDVQWGILQLKWNAPTIVYNDFNLQMVFYWCMTGSKNFLSGFRGSNNNGTDLHNYNLLSNAGTLVPLYGGSTNGKIIATDLRSFVNDPTYFQANGNYTSLLKKYIDAGSGNFNCYYPPQNGTHLLRMTYVIPGHTIVIDKKIQFQNAPTGASGSTGAGSGNPPAGGHKIIKASAD